MISSVSPILQQYELELQSLQSRLNRLQDTNAIDLIDDKMFLSSISESKYEKLMNDRTLGELVTDMKQNKENIESLNELWIIKGLLLELEVSLNPLEEHSYLCNYEELRTIISNLQKLSTRLTKIKDLLIYNSIKDKYVTIATEVAAQLSTYSSRMFSDSFSIELPLKGDQDNLNYKEYVNLIGDFDKLGTPVSIEFADSKICNRWEEYILNQLIEHNTEIQCIVDSKNERRYQIKLCNEITEVTGYFKSILAFMTFVNYVDYQPFRNFFSSKISHFLMNKVSQNAEFLINESNSYVVDILIEISNVAQMTHWSLKISDILESRENLSRNLQKIYDDWVLDERINEIRNLFNDNFSILIEAEETLTVSTVYKEFASSKMLISEDGKQDKGSVEEKSKGAASSDGWEDDNWDSESDKGNEADATLMNDENADDQRVELGSEDAWSKDGWDDNWEIESIKSRTSKEVKPEEAMLIISEVPKKLIELLESFKIDFSYEKNSELISCIKVFSLQNYPPVSKSYKILNDLSFLNTSYLKNAGFQKFLSSIELQARLTFEEDLKKKLSDIDFESYDMSILASKKLNPDIIDKIKQLVDVFAYMSQSELKSSNEMKFQVLLVSLLEKLCLVICNKIVNLSEISEAHCVFLSLIISQLTTSLRSTVSNAIIINCPAFTKLEKISFMLSSHLKEIMEYFYQGELFNLSTDEIISIIQAVFASSALRDDYIREIIDIRNMGQ